MSFTAELGTEDSMPGNLALGFIGTVTLDLPLKTRATITFVPGQSTAGVISVPSTGIVAVPGRPTATVTKE